MNLIVLKHLQIKALPWYINNFKIMLEHSQQISYKEFKQFVQESVVGLGSNKYSASYIQLMRLAAMMSVTVTSLPEMPPRVLNSSQSRGRELK